MRCPVCNSPKTKVLDSRESKDGGIRRRRSCGDCGHRFTTRERIEDTLPTVVKRDGTRQQFDRTKLMRGLEAACRKRPISREQLEAIVRSIEQWAHTRGDREVSADAIGDRVMHHLYALDPVAYVRFVSVYRSFNSVDEFEELLHEMVKAERVNIEGQRTLFEDPGRQPRLPGAPRLEPVPGPSAGKKPRRKKAAGEDEGT